MTESKFQPLLQEDCFDNTFPVCGDCLWARRCYLMSITEWGRL